MDEETRTARQKAIAEKKRRLEEIKARRNVCAASLPPADGASHTASGGNLDEYIDELLKNSNAGLLPVTPSAAVEEKVTVVESTASVVVEDHEEKDEDEEKPVPKETTSAAAETLKTANVSAPQVERFEVAIQCEEDDFPPPSLVDEDEPLEKDDDDDDDNHQEGREDGEHGNAQATITTSFSRDSYDGKQRPPELPSADPLTEEEKAKLIATPHFSRFISTASKRVERLLGASSGEEQGLFGLLANGWGGIDFVEDYATDDHEEEEDGEDNLDVAPSAGSVRKSKRKKKSQRAQEAYQTGGFFTAKATYEFPLWTEGRNITDIEWCPSHKEWILASYNSRSMGRGFGGDQDRKKDAVAVNNPSTRHISPHDPSSSFLSNTTTSSIPNEGIIAIYNLILPTRPEHIFCSGCPIVRCKFHPSEHPKLVVGGGSSGQLLVWDARVGRYPVQRSGMGHDVDLVGMDVLNDESGAGSKLVTASSDGKINYWSVSNMREPIESFMVNANLSCLDVLHGSKNEGVVCGDEKGGLHAVYSTSATTGSGSSSLKRVLRTLHNGGGGFGMDTAAAFDEDPNGTDANEENIGIGHFGMVTSVASRPCMNNSNTPRSSPSEGVYKGFLRRAGGLVVTTGVDWTTKLWAPAYTDRPLMSFLSNSYDYMCDVQWSPVHPSIFATASSNGTINVWNLASSLDQPVSGSDGIPVGDNTPTSTPTDSTSVNPSRSGLNRLRWSADGRRMAVASGDQLHVLGVGDDLWKSKGDEESRVMNNMISRGFIQGQQD
ncbi:hypothetical protein HJC23_007671 [Cyclotella cryptica]|uniref:Uncharacterized protein n=1 Tax=Cyclotella cryptica TaxID=29204 RepID=A0ABD3PRV7_9STRA|eukprot:CCRYP_012228-RB/>CCRYP_012228-RB protein AED:0.06 eAED:0.06 QI:378/1/1/1/0.5/0.33/3/2387/775